MSKLIKIELRTELFIRELDRLEKEGKLPSYAKLAEILGIKSRSTITEIKARRVNIQPDKWEKFKRHFNIKEPETSAKPEHAETVETNEEQLKPPVQAPVMSEKIIQALINISENNRVLALAHKDMTAAQKDLAESNRLLVENNSRLREDLVTARAEKENTADAEPSMRDFLELLAFVASSDRFHTPEEAKANFWQILDKRDSEVKGIQSEKHIQNK